MPVQDSYYIKAQAAVAAAPVGAKVMGTGARWQYRTGDDRSEYAGRVPDFTTLASNNPFGNTNRFTDELGGQTYTNGIVIDWSTYDNATVLGMYREHQSMTDWNDGIDSALVFTKGTFTSGWRIPNYNEMQQFFKDYEGYNYSPLKDGGYTRKTYLISSTTKAIQSTYYFAFPGNWFGLTYQNLKSNDNYGRNGWVPVRDFTVTGTTLT
tara:strand:+ start:844 stop:1470 length:627 start_codon:yes stop_codon:yes gene_type:complete